MAKIPTIDQLKAYLTSIGVPIPPDFILQAWLDTVAVIQPCLDGSGYPASTQLLIYLYLLGLYGISNGDRYVSSETAPSGASRSYRFGPMIDRYRSTRGLLSALDTSGCTSSVIPPEPGPSAGLWVSKGGCC